MGCEWLTIFALSLHGCRSELPCCSFKNVPVSCFALVRCRSGLACWFSTHESYRSGLASCFVFDSSRRPSWIPQPETKTRYLWSHGSHLIHLHYPPPRQGARAQPPCAHSFSQCSELYRNKLKMCVYGMLNRQGSHTLLVYI